MTTMLIHDPGSNLGKLETIWVYLSVSDGGEGVCAVNMLPLVFAEKRLAEKVKPTIRKLVKATGKPVRLVKFGKREDVELFR